MPHVPLLSATAAFDARGSQQVRRFTLTGGGCTPDIGVTKFVHMDVRPGRDPPGTLEFPAVAPAAVSLFPPPDVRLRLYSGAIQMPYDWKSSAAEGRAARRRSASTSSWQTSRRCRCPSTGACTRR
jgi:hypothetical protein